MIGKLSLEWPQAAFLWASPLIFPGGQRQHFAFTFQVADDQTWARIRTEVDFGRIRTGSDCNFFQNWRIRTGSDWENFCCFNVIILKISNILVVIRFIYLFVYSRHEVHSMNTHNLQNAGWQKQTIQNVVQDIEAGEITGLQTLFATALKTEL